MQDDEDAFRRHALRGETYRNHQFPFFGAGTLVVRTPEGAEHRFDCREAEWTRKVWLSAKRMIDGDPTPVGGVTMRRNR